MSLTWSIKVNFMLFFFLIVKMIVFDVNIIVSLQMAGGVTIDNRMGHSAVLSKFI